ncbi:MAG: FtsX-like permease family protein [Candidatus Promineifilaceae bacterium]
MILSTRWRKVIADLGSHKARTLLVILAITVGVFAVGFVANAQVILLRELNRGYQNTAASSARLFVSPIDDEIVDRIAKMPGIEAAEGRRRVVLQVRFADGTKREVLVTAVPDFSSLSLDKVLPVSGQWPPWRDGLLVEQQSIDYLQTAVSQPIALELPGGHKETLTILGTVHDANVPSADIAEIAFGYMTMDTLEALGLGNDYTELRFRVTDTYNNIDDIEAIADDVETHLEKSGYLVFSREIPTPGEHWAQEIIETLVLLFTLFGFLILGLSGFLVVNTITALITQQIQQIGVMKLVGGRRRQITGMYLVMVLVYGMLSLVLGVPLSIVMARWVVGFAANMLNVQIQSYAVPVSVALMQTAVGLLVPLLAALAPVINGVQITTHRALNSLGISSGSRSQKVTDQLMARLQQVLPVQRPLIISFRNTVRKKGRLALTLATLIMGTALFVAVLSVRTSVQTTIDDFLRYRQYDVGVQFERPYRIPQLAAQAKNLSGVTAVEGWLTGTVQRVYADDTIGDAVAITAVPPDTTFMQPIMFAGRWLQSGDEQAIVVNTDFLEEEPDLAVGDEVVLDVNGRHTTWTIVGVSLGSARGTAVYVPYNHYAHLAGLPNQATTLKIITTDHTRPAQEETANQLLAQFEAANFQVSSVRATETTRANIQEKFNIVIGFLVLMAVLLAVVGSLGLTTTMSINVLERIREIGVLRAIGASDSAVRQIVLAEGILIGLISWSIGAFVSWPVSHLLSAQVGVAMLGFPLSYRFSFMGLFGWLAALLVLATAASLGPAHSASKLTIREVLAYE